MTRITYKEHGTALTMTAKGHAGYAGNGQPDIVCAGVSMLCFQLAQIVKNAQDAGQLEEPPEIVLEGGNVRIRCRPKKESRHDMELAYGHAMIGFGLLQQRYPEHVTVDGDM